MVSIFCLTLSAFSFCFLCASVCSSLLCCCLWCCCVRIRSHRRRLSKIFQERTQIDSCLLHIPIQLYISWWLRQPPPLPSLQAWALWTNSQTRLNRWRIRSAKQKRSSANAHLAQRYGIIGQTRRSNCAMRRTNCLNRRICSFSSKYNKVTHDHALHTPHHYCQSHAIKHVVALCIRMDWCSFELACVWFDFSVVSYLLVFSFHFSLPSHYSSLQRHPLHQWHLLLQLVRSKQTSASTFFMHASD